VLASQNSSFGGAGNINYQGPYLPHNAATAGNDKTTFFYCLLPFIEQGNLFSLESSPNNVISQVKGDPTRMVGSYSVKTLQAPNDQAPYTSATWSWPFTNPAEQPIQQTFSSYAPNVRVFGQYDPTVGLDAWQCVWNNGGAGSTTLPSITDGTSNTLAICEKQQVTGIGVMVFKDWGDTTTGGGANQTGNSMWAVTDTQPEGIAFFGYLCNTPNNDWGTNGAEWMLNCQWQTQYQGNTWMPAPTPALASVEYYQPPLARPIPSQQVAWNIYPFNSGGVQALLCDGSVRMITTGISIPVWSAAVTPTGGETLPLP
jgi:hypothetical protein